MTRDFLVVVLELRIVYLQPSGLTAPSGQITWPLILHRILLDTVFPSWTYKGSGFSLFSSSPPKGRSLSPSDKILLMTKAQYSMAVVLCTFLFLQTWSVWVVLIQAIMTIINFFCHGAARPFRLAGHLYLRVEYVVWALIYMILHHPFNPWSHENWSLKRVANPRLNFLRIYDLICSREQQQEVDSFQCLFFLLLFLLDGLENPGHVKSWPGTFVHIRNSS